MNRFLECHKKTLSNKVVWLTGASSGIGFALLQQLLANQARVIVTGRNIEKLHNLPRDYPSQLILLSCDFSDSRNFSDLELRMNRELKKLSIDAIDILVLNAGVCEYIDAQKIDTSVFERMMQVNFQAAVHCCKIAIPFLNNARKKPLIVGVSSLSTALPFTRAQAYGASKAAFTYFLESMRVDLQDSIDISLVSPGFVKTPLTDKNDFSMPFLVSAEHAASKIMGVIRRRPLHKKFPGIFSTLLHSLSVSPRLWIYLSRRMNEARKEALN